jgi:hypothetical protein
MIGPIEGEGFSLLQRCPWCYTVTALRRCPKCGHMVQRRKEECQCPICLEARAIAQAQRPRWIPRKAEE